MSDDPQTNTDPKADPNSVQTRFGVTAQKYVNSPVHSKGYTLDKLVELVQPADGKLAIDLATGGGHVARELAKRGAITIAADLTSPMLSAARKDLFSHELTAEFVQANAQDLPFPDETFDIVTTRLAPHHFPDVRRYVSECARILKRGGVMGLCDHAGALSYTVSQYVNAYEILRDPSHVWEYSPKEWAKMFAEVGMTVEHNEDYPNRLDFDWWTAQQNNDAETVIRLRAMLKQAPDKVTEFLQPDLPATGGWSFTRWMFILLARKA